MTNPKFQTLTLPRGFKGFVSNVGIKDSTDDLVIIAADQRCASSAVFTKSSFSGPSVVISRAHVADGHLQAVGVISKNANVATGKQGTADAEEFAELVAELAATDKSNVLVASTGVIGVPYPMAKIRSGFGAIAVSDFDTDVLALAKGIMTTDTSPKVASATLKSIQGDSVQVVGIAKGVGMIEPDMATMLTFLFTDAEVPQPELDAGFRSAVDRTFNSLSIDTDTSTSDTAAILASGAAGPTDSEELQQAIEEVCLALTRQLASDGEGATKLVVVTVSGAQSDEQAKLVAKSVVNSPLVKTAVHGADPNWGRIAMAIGKSPAVGIDPTKVRIGFAETEVYPNLDTGTLNYLEEYLLGDEVHITCDLGLGNQSWTVYGCDLTDGYIRINADYTT